MNNERYAIILFHTTSKVMAAERLLKKKNIAIKLIPIPRNVSSNCGICIKLFVSLKDNAIQILDEARIEYDSTHIL